MINITGYHIQEELGESATSRTYRGHRLSDEHPVVLKVLKQPYPSPEQIARFKREYEILHDLNLPGVAKAYSIESDRQWWVMALEDFGGSSLARLKLAGKLSIPQFLKLAIQIADILGEIHQLHIMHKDINLSNITLNPETDEVKLIDFGISTILSWENPTFHNPNVLEGTLAYMSPEQTGRMNRPMDYRTDFYSMGVTLYELLTAKLPFPTNDAMELVHYHIAKQPTPPYQRDSKIPKQLSNLVMKLLAKDAEDRYQSAYGLKCDLEICLEQWEASANIELFTLGTHDVSNRFRIPNKLYGRQNEVTVLLDTFERVSIPRKSNRLERQGEMVLISGQPGSGKSVLVQEIYKPVTRRRGYFIKGKFEQLQRNIPYLPLIQAFQSLIKQILTESNTKVALWKENLKKALGPNGQVIVDVIPEVSLIIGNQPDVPALPSEEAKNRFNLVFQNFIKVFAKVEHPLVIFLDDLQWADSASLNLIKLLLTLSNEQYLFFIGAYRDDELLSDSLLPITLQEIEKGGIVIHRITLESLGLADVTQILIDTLACSEDRASPLATLALAKTGGNPFFLNEFLISLYTKKLITFNFEARRWEWDLAEIQNSDITDSVVSLLTNKVEQLNPRTQAILKQAACIGNRFELKTLSIVYQKSPAEIVPDLWEAITNGLIVPLGSGYSLVNLDAPDLLRNVQIEYKFVHERVQQAIYSLIPRSDKQAVHWQVGQLLLKATKNEHTNKHLFDIVNHLNWGRAQATTQDERDKLIHLNFKAGDKAKNSTAYEPAFNYFQAGIELLSAKSWQQDYDLTLALHIGAAESAYLIANFEEMERLTSIVFEKATNLLDKVKAYEVKILAQAAQNNLLEAVDLGLEVLKLLKITFPKKPSKIHSILGLLNTKRLLLGKKIEELSDLPVMTDETMLAAMRILVLISPPAYLSRPDLYALIVLKEIVLSLKWGNTPFSISAYAAYGLILAGRLHDIENGYKFGELALNLLDKFQAKSQKSRALYVVYHFVVHWKMHLKDVVPRLLEAHQSGLETGNIRFSSQAIHSYFFVAVLASENLAHLETEAVLQIEQLKKIKQVGALNYTRLSHQLFLNLRQETAIPWRLMGESYNEEEMLPIHQQEKDNAALFGLHLIKTMLAYMFEAYDDGLENAKIGETFLGSIMGPPHVAFFNFYYSLTLLAVYPHKDKAEQKKILDKVTANQKMMQKWAKYAPMNYLHKHYLVEAERMRVLKEDGQAREYYDEAIELARKHKYLSEEALACEIAARFYLTKKRQRVGHVYLRGAHYAYQRWGAVAKVQHLETKFPELVTQPEISFSRTSLITTPSSTEHITNSLDMISVVKASQTISSEIDLDKLLAKLIKIVIENAGAQRGCLVLVKEGHLLIEAEGTIDQEEVSVLLSIPIEATQTEAGTTEQAELPLSQEIVNYVARTQKSVVLGDASQEGDFTQTLYIIQHQPKSILCVPMVNQGDLIGLIYLENNIVDNAFTESRVEVVQVLGTQATISIANAQAVVARAEQERLRLEQERLQLENKLLEKQSAELARINADKDRFFSIVSHDLRTPFIGLMGNTELMLMDIGTLSKDDIFNMAQDIHNATKLVYNLLENLLTWSTIQRGRMKYYPEEVDLANLAITTVALLTEMADRKKIKLTSTIKDNTLAYIDRNMIDTVIRNITSNALKFTADGDSVTLSAEPCVSPSGRIDPNPLAINRFMLVSVTDTGIGIAEDVVNKLFKIDEHHSTSGTAKEQGTGLGLILCQQMVERNGGKIWIESKLGQGTTVKFTVPTDSSVVK